jgi:hypothetical protein
MVGTWPLPVLLRSLASAATSGSGPNNRPLGSFSFRGLAEVTIVTPRRPPVAFTRPSSCYYRYPRTQVLRNDRLRARREGRVGRPQQISHARVTPAVDRRPARTTGTAGALRSAGAPPAAEPPRSRQPQERHPASRRRRPRTRWPTRLQRENPAPRRTAMRSTIVGGACSPVSHGASRCRAAAQPVTTVARAPCRATIRSRWGLRVLRVLRSDHAGEDTEPGRQRAAGH